MIRARVVAAVAALALIGVSVFGAALPASAAPLNPPVFTHPAPGLDPDDWPQIEGDLVPEGANVDVVVTVTNSDGIDQAYCADNNIDTAVTPFFSCLGTPLPYGDNTFTATVFFTATDPLHLDPSPSAQLLYQRWGMTLTSVSSSPASPTGDATLQFGGNGPELGSVDVFRNEPGNPRICTDVPVAADSTWACSGTALPPGDYELIAVGTTVGGVESFSGSYNVTILPFATIQQTFTPWWTRYDGVQVQGSMSGNTTLVEVFSSPNFAGPFVTPFCSEPGVPDPELTIYFCDSPPGSLQPGDNYLATRVTATNGAVSAFSTPILVTLVETPVIATPTENSYTNDPQVSFSGTAPDFYFNTIEVADGDEGQFMICNAVVVPGDTWQCTSPPLPDGTYTPFGEASPNFIYSERVTFTVDTSVPLPAVVNPLSTSDVTPTLTGTGEVGADITVFVDGFTAACTVPAVVDSGGSWSCTLVDPDRHRNARCLRSAGRPGGQRWPRRRSPADAHDHPGGHPDHPDHPDSHTHSHSHSHSHTHDTPTPPAQARVDARWRQRGVLARRRRRADRLRAPCRRGRNCRNPLHPARTRQCDRGCHGHLRDRGRDPRRHRAGRPHVRRHRHGGGRGTLGRRTTRHRRRARGAESCGAQERRAEGRRGWHGRRRRGRRSRPQLPQCTERHDDGPRHPARHHRQPGRDRERRGHRPRVAAVRRDSRRAAERDALRAVRTVHQAACRA